MARLLNEQLERLRELVRKAYGAVAGKGGVIPEAGDRTMENLPSAIESVPQELPSPVGALYLDGNGNNIANNVFFNKEGWRDALHTIDDSITTELASSYYNVATFILSFTNCHLLEYARFRECKTVGQGVMRYCDGLKKVIFDKCTNILSTPSALEACKNLEEVEVEGAIFLGNANQVVRECPKLRRIYCPNITGINTWNDTVIQNCPNLIDIEFGEKIGGNLNISSYRPTNALLSDSQSLLTEEDIDKGFTCNLEKFLWNWKNHVAANLPDRSGTDSWTITFSQDVRDALTEEIEAAFTAKNWNIAPAKSV